MDRVNPFCHDPCPERSQGKTAGATLAWELFQVAALGVTRPQRKTNMAPSDNKARFNQSYFNQARFVTGEETQQRKRRMTNLQIDDVLGFGNLLRAAANEHKAKMVANDYDPTARIASTATTSGTLGDKKLQAKTSQIEATRKVEEAENLKQSYYEDLSSWCETMAGAVGKGTPEGKAILAIRANLKSRGANTPPPTPPTPPSA